MKKYSKFALPLLAAGLLSACQTTGKVSPEQETRSDKIDSALKRAAEKSGYKGEGDYSLAYLERIYKRNNGDAQAAIDYARALRENDYLTRASLVLAPFAKDPGSPVEAKIEFAAIQLAQGNNEAAEQYAQKAVLQDEKNAQAYHYLGIALDAQTMHPQAEKAFRKALDYWEGDPTTIMNNLALNLATQEYLDEALEILKKAQSIAPERMEIERNLRIVRALKQTAEGGTPKPITKPVKNRPAEG